MNHSRFLFPLFSLAAVLFSLALVHQRGSETAQLLQAKLTLLAGKGSPNEAQSLPSFVDVALKHGTDKVTTHSYQHMYDKYLSPLQSRPVKLLEIGLGCNMVCRLSPRPRDATD